MKFVDSASVRVEAGKGGAGCLSFRREKYIQMVAPMVVMVETAGVYFSVVKKA